MGVGTMESFLFATQLYITTPVKWCMYIIRVAYIQQSSVINTYNTHITTFVSGLAKNFKVPGPVGDRFFLAAAL